MKKYSILLIFYAVCFPFSLQAINLIEPDDIFEPHELEDILRKSNFFHYLEFDDETPIWVGTGRKYSHHLLGDRTHIFDLKDVVHKVLTDGFPIQQSMEQLYRSKAEVHSSLGRVLPQFNMNLADAAQFGVSNAFSSVFSFMLPANWLKLGNSAIAYKTTKLILVKNVLDQMLEVKNVFIDVHKMIIDYEILNYYYVHLQIFAKRYPQSSREILTVMGYMGLLGTDIAAKRADLKLGFDLLAQVMALEKSRDTYTAGRLNIKEIENFEKHLHELDSHEDHFKDKESYIREAVRMSLELKIINQFYKMSKLDVGITASGGALSVTEKPGTTIDKSELRLSLGYENLPNILISKSLSRSAKIDVQSNYIDFLTTVRILLDVYQNAHAKYAEGKQALQLNRMALKKNLDYFLHNNNKIPDAGFVLALSQLVQSELGINYILHSMFRAKVGLNRYLLKDKVHALQYLPTEGAILKALAEVKGDTMAEIFVEQKVDKALRKVGNWKDLYKILYDHRNHPDFALLNDEELKHVIQRNIGNLLHSKLLKLKRKKFYQVLEKYIREKNITLTPMEEFILKEKQDSLLKRYFQRKKTRHPGDFLHNLDFEHFEKLPPLPSNESSAH